MFKAMKPSIKFKISNFLATKCMVVYEDRQHWNRPTCWIYPCILPNSHTFAPDYYMPLWCTPTIYFAIRMPRAISNCTYNCRSQITAPAKCSSWWGRRYRIPSIEIQSTKYHCTKLRCSDFCTIHKPFRCCCRNRRSHRNLSTSFELTRQILSGSLVFRIWIKKTRARFVLMEKNRKKNR